MTNRIWISVSVAAILVATVWIVMDRNQPAHAQPQLQKNNATVWSSLIGKKCDVTLLKDAGGVRFNDCTLIAADTHWIHVRRMKQYNYVFPRENIASVTMQVSP